MHLPLKKTQYSLESAAEGALIQALQELDEQMNLLRSSGDLSAATLKNYYGETRYDQIAESNAIEGSTLSVGETQLAVEKGTTLTGHDPAFVKDARTLAVALVRLEQLAQRKAPTELEEVVELHQLIFGDRPGGGMFRDHEVIISQSQHKPPKTKKEITIHMTALNAWSLDNADVNPIFRAVVLHAWFTNIHPFVDGNGRTARAITTLELVRGGYPPMIIRKNRDRKRYLEALSHSDEGGDLSALAALFIDRAMDALRDLQRSAKKHQGYDLTAQRAHEHQRRCWTVFLTSLELLQGMIELGLGSAVAGVGGTVAIRLYAGAVDFDDYIALCMGNPSGNRWAFQIEISIPTRPMLRLLCWVGFGSPALPFGTARGPSLFWSQQNPAGFPPWIRTEQSPYARELASIPGRGDAFVVVRNDGQVIEERLSDLARKTADAIVQLVTASHP